MKRYISSSFDIDNYIKRLQMNVESELQDTVKSVTIDMIDGDEESGSIVANVEFFNGDRKTYTFEKWRLSMNSYHLNSSHLYSDVDIIVNNIVNDMRSSGTLPPDSDFNPYWEEISHKRVEDSSGFQTDYTLYYNESEDRYVCIFGDKDLYDPSNTDPDFECECGWEALEWFDNYKGFYTDDDDEPSSI